MTRKLTPVFQQDEECEQVRRTWLCDDIVRTLHFPLHANAACADRDSLNMSRPRDSCGSRETTRVYTLRRAAVRRDSRAR